MKILPFLFLCNQASAADSLNVLFIGNSFTHMHEMPAIFSKIAESKNKKIHVEWNTQAGASFAVHSQREALFKAIKKREWDYVILQGFSREFTVSNTHLDTATIPYLTQIIDSVKEFQPCANLLFYVTWGYKNGFPESEDLDTYDKMSQKIQKGYAFIGKKYDIPLVPVGNVFQLVRAKYPKLNLYAEDEIHPSKEGSYLAACTFYTAIFKESCIGALTNTIAFEDANRIQETVSNYVLRNLQKFSLHENTFSVKSFKQVLNGGKSMTQVTCSANYPDALSYSWETSSGIVSNGSKLVFNLTEPGKYRIKFTMTRSCGEVKSYVKELIVK
jgi:hypothetical protein